MNDESRKAFEDALDAYWNCAYNEGRFHQSNGSEANEILHKIHAAFKEAVLQATQRQKEKDIGICLNLLPSEETQKAFNTLEESSYWSNGAIDCAEAIKYQDN